MTIKLHVLIRKITKSTRSILQPIRNIIWSIYFVRTVKIFKKFIFKIHCFIIHYYNKDGDAIVFKIQITIFIKYIFILINVPTVKLKYFYVLNLVLYYINFSNLIC